MERPCLIHIRDGADVGRQPSAARVTAADAILGFKRLCNPRPCRPARRAYFTATIARHEESPDDGFAQVDAKSAAAIKDYIDSHNVSGLKAVDATTLQITLTQPASDFVNILSLPFSSPAPVEYLNYIPGSARQAQHTISDGPYAITHAHQPSKSITLARNPAWRGVRRPDS